MAKVEEMEGSGSTLDPDAEVRFILIYFIYGRKYFYLIGYFI